MNIFSLPVEVVDGNVLPYLEWNDLLRLRRVCKWTKAITDGYMKVHPELAPEIEISENLEGKGLAAFMKMGIPTTRIFLNNTSGDQFYEEAGEDLAKFLDCFGSFVKSLRLDQISLILIGKELEFLNGLKNLESLESKRCGGYGRRGLNPLEVIAGWLVRVVTGALNEPTLPQNGESPMKFMKGLTSLKIANANYQFSTKLFDYIDCLLTDGKALSSISLPFSTHSRPSPTSPYYILRDSPLGVHFAVILSHINGRIQKSLPNFKEIDFVSHHQSVHSLQQQFDISWNASPYFLILCTKCVTNGIKLLNVASSWFMARETRNIPGLRGDSPDLGIPVCSLVNMDPSVFSLNMPNLKRIEIKSSSRSSIAEDWRNERPTWQSLKDLDITVDSTISNYSERNQDLFNFFFEGVSRTVLTTLRLKFEAGTVAVPNTEHIVAACPNLKKLTLVNWPGTNESLIKLWNGLAELEEVSLENCKTLGNEAFIGEDVGYPVFRKLSKLKKLSLKGLDTMPRITDTLFSLVLRHLPLTHLTLTSNAPVQSIIEAGVQMLLGGKFAESIEKFPFKDWSLENLSVEEFKKLEEMFRSSKMM